MNEKFNPSYEHRDRKTEFRLSEEEVWGNPELEREYIEERRPAIEAGEKVWLQGHVRIDTDDQEDEERYNRYRVMSLYDKEWHGEYCVDLSKPGKEQVTSITLFDENQPTHKERYQILQAPFTEEEARAILEQSVVDRAS